MRLLLLPLALLSACPASQRSATSVTNPSNKVSSMPSLDRVIDVLTRDALSVDSANAALVDVPSVAVFAVPSSTDVSHAELELSPTIPVAMLVEAYGEPGYPPAMGADTVLAFYPPEDPERKYNAVLFVTEVASQAVSARVRRDAR